MKNINDLKEVPLTKQITGTTAEPPETSDVGSSVNVSKLYSIFSQSLTGGQSPDIDQLKETLAFDSLDPNKQQLLEKGFESIQGMSSNFNSMFTQMQQSMAEMMTKMSENPPDLEPIDPELKTLIKADDNSMAEDMVEEETRKLEDSTMTEYFNDPKIKESLTLIQQMIPQVNVGNNSTQPQQQLLQQFSGNCREESLVFLQQMMPQLSSILGEQIQNRTGLTLEKQALEIDDNGADDLHEEMDLLDLD